MPLIMATLGINVTRYAHWIVQVTLWKAVTCVALALNYKSFLERVCLQHWHFLKTLVNWNSFKISGVLYFEFQSLCRPTYYCSNDEYIYTKFDHSLWTEAIHIDRKHKKEKNPVNNIDNFDMFPNIRA